MKCIVNYVVPWLLLLVLSCSPQSPESVNPANTLLDATGTAITLNATPERIISLAPSLTENVYLSGCGDKLVGVTVYCEYPEAAQTKGKIGTLLEPDIERIIALKPDLVLATKEGNKPEIVKSLRNLGIRVFVFSEINSCTDIKNGFRQLARLLDKTREAEVVLNNVEEKINQVRSRVSRLTPKRVFIQLSAQPLMTAGPDTFIDEIINLAGGLNIAHSAKMRYPIYSLEEIVRQNPEVIIITDMGDIALQAKKEWAKLPELSAVKEDRIIILDKQATHYLCAPSPTGFAQAVERMAQYLHPIK